MNYTASFLPMGLVKPSLQGYATIPVIIGSVAEFIPENMRTLPELSHRWKCYVQIQPSLVKSVHFKLHESFVNPVKVIEHAPFEIVEQGWGEFNIQLKITLFNGEKLVTNHYLSLHSDSYPHISERIDTIVYKGNHERIDPEYNFIYEGEDDEYARISTAIADVLDLYDQAKVEL
ncbi:YEATS domain-containing protein 4 [Pancytospora epiphaga]|nr:YEATS domain-containing protein 4 [Pancytospora epiphaga]